MAHGPHSITFNATAVGQMTDISHNTGGTVQRGSSGEVDPQALFQGDSPHSTSFTSTDIEGLLALNSGAFITSGLYISGSNVTVPFRKRSSGSTFATGSSHAALQSGKTFTIPMSMSAQGSNPVQMQCDIKYLSADGFTSPISKVTGQTLTQATFNKEYLLKKIEVNGTAVPELTGFTLNFGITVIEQKTDGGPFTQSVYISLRDPTVDITTEDLDAAMSVINATEVVEASGGLIIYLARRKKGSIVYADDEQISTTSQHIKIVANAGLWQATTIGAQAAQNGSGTIRLTASGDDPASTAVLVATNNVDIV